MSRFDHAKSMAGEFLFALILFYLLVQDVYEKLKYCTMEARLGRFGYKYLEHGPFKLRTKKEQKTKLQITVVLKASFP